MNNSANELANKLIHSINKLNWLPFDRGVFHENDDSLFVRPKELLMVDDAVYIKGGKIDGCRIRPVDLDKMSWGRERDCKTIFEDTPTYRPEMGGVIVTREAALVAQSLNRLPQHVCIHDVNRVANGLANLIQVCNQLK